MAQSAEGLLKAGMKTNKPRRIRKGEPGYGKKKFVVVASHGGKNESFGSVMPKWRFVETTLRHGKTFGLAMVATRPERRTN